MTRSIALAASLFASIASPARGQDHSAHEAQRSAEASACEREAERHRAMGHAVPAGRCAPTGHDGQDDGAMDHGAMDHDAMDHGAVEDGSMDHGAMDHGVMVSSAPAAIPILPPPAVAGSGLPRAADAIWGAEAMRESRDALRRDHGGQNYARLILDRFEYRARNGVDGFLWDGDAFYGGDLERVWLESEGEGAFGEGIEEADLALLYGRAVSPWFDLQAGIRQDLTGPKRTYLDLGIQGLAPYLFHVEADLYLSNEGDLTAAAELELDQRITQRVILQPRAEIALAAQDVPELGIGAGVDQIEAGLRLRYEIAREFAPYVGVEQEWKLGQSANYARAGGEDPSMTHYVVGLRFWF